MRFAVPAKMPAEASAHEVDVPDPGLRADAKFAGHDGCGEREPVADPASYPAKAFDGNSVSSGPAHFM
jgi:hypothetical protein